MERTQIYLTKDQKDKLSEMAKLKGETLAQVIREAVDTYFISTKKDYEDHILKTSGIWKDRNDIPNAVDYVNDIREKMNSSLVILETNPMHGNQISILFLLCIRLFLTTNFRKSGGKLSQIAF